MSFLTASLLLIATVACTSTFAHEGHEHHNHNHHHEGEVKMVEEVKGIMGESHGHVCDHDSEAMVRDLVGHGQDINHPQQYTSKHGEFHTQSVGTIRIAISSADMDAAAGAQAYCTAAGATAKDYKTTTPMTCTGDHVLTAAKKAILLNNIIPAAIAKLSSVLSVTRIVGNLIVPNTHSVQYFTIPSALKTTGVAADFLLLVSAGPTPAGNVAWAGYTLLDQNNRPIIGRMNFSPQYMVWSATDAQKNAETVGILVHEIMHALGFSGSYIGSYMAAMRTTVTNVRGKTVTHFTGTNALREARNHFNCQTITGVEIEDEGSIGSAGSHWERRQHMDDVMAAMAGKVRISRLTLGFFQDTGKYTVNYANAEDQLWAKNAGCGLLSSKCNEVAGGKDSMFCFDTVSTNRYCTKDGARSVGVCQLSTWSSALPTWFQYFASATTGGQQFMDGCPVVQGYGNMRCDDATQVSSISRGETYGPGGRCMVTSGLLQTGWTSSSSPLRCMKLRCPGGTRIQFTLSGTSTAWNDCPLNGAAGTVNAPTGYQGTISCPTAASVCTPDLLFGTAPATPAPGPTPAQTPAPTTAAIKATPAPTTAAPPSNTYTVKMLARTNVLVSGVNQARIHVRVATPAGFPAPTAVVAEYVSPTVALNSKTMRLVAGTTNEFMFQGTPQMHATNKAVKIKLTIPVSPVQVLTISFS